MTPERWALVERVVAAALALEASARHAYIDEACAGDAEIRREVESLLAYVARGVAELTMLGGNAVARAVAAPLVPGRMLGRYVVEARIGAGGMGEVFLARDERLGRRAALKLLPADGPVDPNALRRFAREAKAASALNHPNIVTVYDLGEEPDGTTYIAMEYVEGRTLRERLADGPLSIAETLAVARQAGAALAAAHEAGIVHRDIKPENLMLRPDGYLKVLDFGIAKLLAPEAPAGGARPAATTGASTPGVVVGTVRYMSPEQARGLEVGPQSDVWSLGVVLYESLVGRNPFAGETMSDTLVAILERTPPSAGALRPDAPPELVALIERALEKSTAARTPTMRALLDDLARLATNAAPVDTAPRVATTEVVSAAQPVPANVPVPVTSFVGRAGDVDRVRAALAANRLVTLKGEGGLGKTRLALETAAAEAADSPEDVWFVELGPLTDPGLVVSRVASALGVREHGVRDLVASIADVLRGRRALLVLDNCEHLVDACSRLSAELLRACGRLRILATSREALGVAGELLWDVRPLAVPGDDAAAGSVEDLGANEAVRLFVERARLVRPDFGLTAANAATVAGIARRLEGIALAIELAASKVRVLTPEQILERLDDRFALLVGGDRTAEPRQRSLHAALAWSHDLLAEDERALFRRLAVFAGGWTLDAAEEVTSDDGGAPVARGAVLDLLTRLVDKSLVRAAPRGGTVRYAMLETVRAYALARLREVGEEAAAVAAHARNYLRLAAEPADEGGAPLAASREWVEDELDDLRAALAWAIERGNAPAEGLAACASLGEHYWNASGHAGEGRAWLEAALAAAPDADEATRERAERWLSQIMLHQGDYPAATVVLEALLAQQRTRGDSLEVCDTLSWLGWSAERAGRLEEALAYRREALTMARRLGDPLRLAHGLSHVGVEAMRDRRFDEAASFFADALDIFLAEGDLLRVAIVRHNLGENALRRGALEDARRFLEESVVVARRAGRERIAAHSNRVLANVETASGNLEASRALLLGVLATHEAGGDLDGVAFALEGFARLAAAGGDAARAIRLAGAAEAIRRTLGAGLDAEERAELDRSLGPARTALGAERAAAERAAGLATGVDAAIADARTPS